MPRRYGKYVENSTDVPRQTRHNRRKRRTQDSSSSDDSDKDMKWRELSNNNDNYDTNSSEDEDSVHLPPQPASIQSDVLEYSSSPLLLPVHDVSDDDVSMGQMNVNESLPPNQIANRHSLSMLNGSSEVFGFTDSEDEPFQDSWIPEANSDLLNDSNDDYNDSTSSDEDNNMYQQLNDCHSESNASNVENQFSRLKKILEEDDSNETLNKPLVVSKSEILLSVLKFGLTYNLPQSGLADMFKMLNSFFGSSIFPDTRYLINKIFTSEENVNLHAVCPTCKAYVKKFTREERRITCNLCNTQILLKSPTYTDFFAVLNVNIEIINLIKENSKHYKYVTEKRLQSSEKFEELTDGILYKEFINFLSDVDKRNFVTATFNSDGSPVFESSKFSIWPIQFIINELSFHVRTSKPIVCGIWFGKDKPDMNIFLKPFVTYMNQLANEGLQCIVNNENHHIKLFTICCCVDSVARAPMQGLVQFNGYYGCSWCLHPGFYIVFQRGGSVKYILSNEVYRNRTEAETVLHMQESISSPNPVYGVKRPTVLLNLQAFNVISGFVPDSMHCINLGIADQFLNYWVDSCGLPYSLTNDNITNIDAMMKTIKVPNKVTRLSRSIKDRRWWKAREWENWVLYYSIPILLSFPHFERYVQHWSLLVEAYYILLQQSITREEVTKADNLLKDFVCSTEEYYSQSAMTYNIHQLLHLAQSVVNLGPLWAHSGYCFESGNGQIVKKVHAAKGVLHQICRIMSMNQCELVLKAHIASSKPFSAVSNFVSYLDKKFARNSLKISQTRYFGPNRSSSSRWIEELQLSKESKVYDKIVKEQCLYTSCKKHRLRSNNSFAKTQDGIFILILQFIVDPLTRKEFTIYKKVNTVPVFDNDYISMRKVTNISNELVSIQTSKIERVCVFISIGDVMYISAVPNLNSY